MDQSKLLLESLSLSRNDYATINHKKGYIDYMAYKIQENVIIALLESDFFTEKELELLNEGFFDSNTWKGLKKDFSKIGSKVKDKFNNSTVGKAVNATRQALNKSDAFKGAKADIKNVANKTYGKSKEIVKNLLTTLKNNPKEAIPTFQNAVERAENALKNKEGEIRKDPKASKALDILHSYLNRVKSNSKEAFSKQNIFKTLSSIAIAGSLGMLFTHTFPIGVLVMITSNLVSKVLVGGKLSGLIGNALGLAINAATGGFDMGHDEHMSTDAQARFDRLSDGVLADEFKDHENYIRYDHDLYDIKNVRGISDDGYTVFGVHDGKFCLVNNETGKLSYGNLPAIEKSMPSLAKKLINQLTIRKDRSFSGPGYESDYDSL